MTGKEKFKAALSPGGSAEFPAAICYHGIFLRDHWAEVTGQPWWAFFERSAQRATPPWADMIRRTGEDWFAIPGGFKHEDQQAVSIERSGDGVFLLDKRTGKQTPLEKPPVGGEQSWAAREAKPLAHGVGTLDKLDELMDRLYGPRPGSADAIFDNGTMDAARILIREFGQEKLPLAHITSPFWYCYSLWGFEGMMVGLVETPELIIHTCRRFLDANLRNIKRLAASGVEAVWIEDCMTDMLSPEQSRRFSLPWLRALTEAIRATGMLSVHYYCGRFDDRWDLLTDSGADALALEESKKGFVIDIADVAQRLDGRMALLGNVDAIGVLERGSEEDLHREIARQCAAGRTNRNRFAVSIGSPVTPGTPLSRVRRYCDLVHELGHST